MMRTASIPALLLLGALASPLAGSPSPAGDDAPGPPRTASRAVLSPSAAEDLRAVAALRTGEVVPRLVEGESPGTFGLTLAGTSCALPEAAHGRVARLEAALAEKAMEDVEALAPFADGDGSGRVTPAEGRAFRDLVEFGYLASLLRREKGLALEGLALAAGLQREEATARISRYNALAGRLNGATGRPMPVITLEPDP